MRSNARLCLGWLLLYSFGALAAATSDYAVQVSATVQASPPRITLNWPAIVDATGYTVYRKAPSVTAWGTGTTLGAVTTYQDSSVVVGQVYEYRVTKIGGVPGNGYVLSGIEVPLVESRGTVVFVVEDTFATDLASELSRMEQDLVGDGWTVSSVSCNRADTVPSVKAKIKAVYDVNPAAVKAIFLFGRVPVPYSGNIAPDGHGDHVGAWPADVYYGDMDGTWTDTTVNNTAASRVQNDNIPGDGKFDQSSIPTDVEVAVGRVDLTNMTAFAPKTELDLLRQYLNKDHDFRHKILTAQPRALIDDNFGAFSGEAFAASGWRSFAPMFGAANVAAGDYFTGMATNTYLWSYGCGGGSYSGASGVGSTTNFVSTDPKTIFTLLFGSYHGDWDSTNNFMRAPLASATHGLTCAWSGRPHWFFHHMALGEAIGVSTRLTQNNSGVYSGFGRSIHIGLMGDPTLRMFVVAPASAPQAVQSGSNVAVSWTASIETVLGYHVYRSTAASGPYTRLNGALVTATSYNDVSVPLGSQHYMIRAVKLETSASGSYFNAGQGVFANLIVQPPVNTAPTISNIADTSTNEDTATPARAFTVGDAETPLASLIVSGSSSNTTLVPNANVTFGGSGASRTVTVTPAANLSGTATITVTVSDGALSASDTFVLTVNAVNDPPTISNIADRSTNEDTSTGAVAFTVGDLETAVGSLTLSGGSSNTTLVPVANITFGGSGASRTVTVVPAANQAGTATITVTVSDGALSASDTFVLTVVAQNDPPTIANIPDRSTNEDTSTGAIAFTVGDLETAAGSLTLSGGSSNTTLVPVANMTFGGSGANRSVTVVPAANQSGTATITITVNDGTATASDSFVLTVTAQNDAPTISDITNKTTLTGIASGPHTFTVGDVETAAGSLTLTRASSNTSLVPVANIVFGGSGANRTVTVTPVAGQQGTATITVTVSDGSLTASDTFVLTVSPANNVPTAADGSLVTSKNTAKSGTLIATDADGQPLTYSLVGNGTLGTAVITDPATGAFTYTPNPKKSGTDTFTFKASDGAADSNVATVTVSIANGRPSVSDGSVDTTVAEPVGGTLTAADADNDELTYEVVSQGTLGTVTISDPATGAFVYTPDAGAVGTDTFTFRVFDGDEFSDLATITVTVNEPLVINSVPTATPNPASIGESVQFTISATGSGALAYAWDFGDGSAGIGASAGHTFAAAGVYAVSVTITDATGASASGSLTVTVVDNGGGGGGGGGGGSGPERVAMTVSKLSGAMNFAASGKDSVSISGVIPGLPKGFNPTGLPAVLDIGGATTAFTLNAKGAGKTVTGTFALKLKPSKKNPATKKSEFVGGNAAFKAKLSKGSWSAAWADEGVNPSAGATKQSMSMIAELQFNGKIYAATVTVLYSAKAGKSGKFKK